MTGNSKPRSKFLMLLKNDFLASARVISLFYIALVILIGFFFVCASLQGGSISGEFAEKVILAFPLYCVRVPAGASRLQKSNNSGGFPHFSAAL